MTYALTWLAEELREHGLTVVEVDGWKTRGHGDMSKVEGVLCHHTAGPPKGDAPSLPTIINGRPDLAGPLSQLFLSRSGVWHVVAAGKAWHAGAGTPGTPYEHYDGNGHLVGIEAENTGLADDPWPEVQMDSYARGVAAILARIGRLETSCVGHKEYAARRKVDPSFKMDVFRAKVGVILRGLLTA